ncbi:hypothetical protein [Sphingobium yanoikuyae]|uniref:hypothetical protein n=1 Tax=Sphingobium yanoikuyae TaxID=13690 RepID=UPI0026ECBEB3|nr:hypothetical protein [Sphingobium yanoikuyae]
MSSLTDHLSPTPIQAPCAVRVGGHSFGFGAQFFAIATNSNPVGSQPQDGAEGRSPSPALGANVSTLDHAATANGKAQQDHG